MRWKFGCLAALAAACSAPRIASAQPVNGPPLLPSMVSAHQYIAEEISDPWYPPAELPQLTFPGVPATASETFPSAAIISDEIAPADELPFPAATMTQTFNDEPVSEIPIIDETPPAWYRPTGWFGPLPWDTGIELGVNGSSGTNEALSIRTGGSVKRESRFSKLDLSGYYNKTTSQGDTTQNNATLDVRNDWLLDDTSSWTLYGTANAFYDEFQAFEAQVNANSGVGYRFVHEPQLGMIGRVGVGTSREIGGPDDRWVPESLFGFEFTRQLFTTQKLYGKIDYFPEFEELGEFRVVADIGWEVELVQPSNLSLKISANDRYDSTPNGAEPHLVNYSILLLLKL